MSLQAALMQVLNQQGASGVNTVFSWDAFTSLTAATGGAPTTKTRSLSAWCKDNYGQYRELDTDEFGFVGARRERNLATALTTHSITVVTNAEYQCTINGAGVGDTAVFSNAFTGTLTTDGTNRISWNSGAPKTATTTTLTITVTGTLTELLVQNVTNRSNQNPSEALAVSTTAVYGTENGNTVNGSGVVTNASGAALTSMEGVQIEGASTDYSHGVSGFNANGTATKVADAIGPTGRVSQLCTATSDTNRLEIAQTNGAVSANVALSLFMKQSSTSGTLRIVNAGGTSNGQWTVNLANLPTTWTQLTASSSYVTVLNAWKRGSSGQSPVRLYDVDQVTALSWYMEEPQIEENPYPTSPIVTAGSSATRAAQTLHWNSLTSVTRDLAFVAEVRAPFSSSTTPNNPYIWTLFGDTSNSFQLFFGAAGNVTIRKRHGGTNVDASASTTWSAGDLLTVTARSTSAGIKVWVKAANGSNADSNSLSTAATGLKVGASGDSAMVAGQSLRLGKSRIWVTTIPNDTQLADWALNGYTGD